MKYSEEMILQSRSGYCMPFEEEKNKEEVNNESKENVEESLR